MAFRAAPGGLRPLCGTSLNVQTSALQLPTARAGSSVGPSVKQVAYYRRLAESPVFTDEVRRRAM
jgi:hypothetical protein